MVAYLRGYAPAYLNRLPWRGKLGGSGNNREDPMASDETLAYTEDSVWSVQFLRTKRGKTNAYIKHLSEAWKPVMEEAIQRRIIVSYRVLLSNFTSPNDWDVMIVIELENMAALDGYSERLRQVEKDLGAGNSGGCSVFLEDSTEHMRLTRQIAFK
jgi:hypothetical protein